MENEPVLLINAQGRYWANSLAAELISQRDISLQYFAEWIRMGSSHLSDISHRDLQVHMCRLGSEEVVAILKPGGKATGTLKETSLTDRQKKIICYVLKGFSNREIADRMSVSPGTVNTHLDNIYRKLRCSSRLEAAIIALKKGLILSSAERPKLKRSKYQ